LHGLDTPHAEKRLQTHQTYQKHLSRNAGTCSRPPDWHAGADETSQNIFIGDIKMATQIRIQCCETIDEALAKHAQITGSEFFECYENSKRSTVKCAEWNRESMWMVDLDKGDIYYITECPDRLLVLNKLSLCSCMDNNPFKTVCVSEGLITIYDDGRGHSRSAISRKALAALNVIVTT